MKHLALAALAALTGCEGWTSLNDRGCLPLQVPAQVVTQQESGLYTVRESPVLILNLHPRDTTNDAFNGVTLVRTLPPGTTLNVRDLKQQHGFDSGAGRISAFGTTDAGEEFEFGWGAGTQIGRAPWEPASVGNLRTVACSG